MPSTLEPDQSEAAHPDWFRPPSRRENLIAAGLFIGFGIFFVLLFILCRGWWFRWVLLTLAIYSILKGMRHLVDSFKKRVGTTDENR